MKDILNAALLVSAFVEGFEKAAFMDDWKTRSAVLYQLTVVGEAVKRLSAEFRLAHAQVPWGLMAGMRDHLIHAYDLVDWDEVWQTATRDVSGVLEEIKRLSK